MISLSFLVTLMIQLIVAATIFWLLVWLVDYVALPQPFSKIARILLAVVAVLFLVGLLLSLGTGQPLLRMQ